MHEARKRFHRRRAGIEVLVQLAERDSLDLPQLPISAFMYHIIVGYGFVARLPNCSANVRIKNTIQDGWQVLELLIESPKVLLNFLRLEILDDSTSRLSIEVTRWVYPCARQCLLPVLPQLIDHA